MNTKLYELNARRILETFDLTAEDYLKLDKDVKLALLRDYWDRKINNHNNILNGIKTKVLSSIKRK